jgi:hypothetical protein
MNVRDRVEPAKTERHELKALLSRGRHAAGKLRCAHILLAADAGASDEETRGASGQAPPLAALSSDALPLTGAFALSLRSMYGIVSANCSFGECCHAERRI